MPDTRWTVTEHVGRDGFDAVAPDWRRLYSAMPDRAMWHSHEAWSAYLDHVCPQPDAFRCLALSDDERVRAILPIEEYVERGLGAPIRVWGMPWPKAWRPGDAITADEEAHRALVPAIVAHLREHPRRPAVLVLGRTWAGSALWDGLADLEPTSWFAFDDGAEYVVPTDMPFDEFLQRLSGKSRAALRKAARGFEQLPDATCVRAVTRDEVASELDNFLDVEASGWKGQRGSAIKQRPGHVDYYRALLERVSQDGHCEIHSLHAQGRCIASEFCVYTGRECVGLMAGYDEWYGRIAPGRLIVHKTLEWSCEDPDIDVVSEVSDADWLRQWRPNRNEMRRAYVSLRPVSGRLALAALRTRYGPVRRLARAMDERDRRRQRSSARAASR